jgi:uncharacterized glyoxalase superfamily protein PhnB
MQENAMRQTGSTGHHVWLVVQDAARSKRFYTEVLGFTCESVSEEWGWAALQCDGVALMLSGLNLHEGDVATAFTGSLYLRTDDVDRLWDRLKDRARVCYPIADFEYGMREFGIYDNNGYLLQFGQESSRDADA